jgi:hypothetical protein
MSARPEVYTAKVPTNSSGRTVEGQSAYSRKVNIRKMKEFALSSLPEGSVLKRILLSDKDEIEVVELVAKIDLWLKLLSMEFS